MDTNLDFDSDLHIKRDKQIALLDKGIESLQSKRNIHITLKMSLEQIHGVKITKDVRASLESMAGAKKALLKFTVVWLILALIGSILKKTRGRGSSSGGGSGGGITSRSMDPVAEAVRKMYGQRDSRKYTYDEVWLAVIAMPVNDIPGYVQHDLILIAKAVSNKHVDDIHTAMNILKHFKSEDELSIECSINYGGDKWSSLFFKHEQNKGLNIIRKIMEAMHHDLQLGLQNYTEGVKNYHDTLSFLLDYSTKSKEERQAIQLDMPRKGLFGEPMKKYADTVRSLVGKSSDNIDTWGYVRDYHSMLSTLLNSEYNQKLSSAELLHLFKNEGHEFLNVMEKHKPMLGFMEDINKHVVYGSGMTDEVAKKVLECTEMYDKVKAFIAGSEDNVVGDGDKDSSLSLLESVHRQFNAMERDVYYCGLTYGMLKSKYEGVLKMLEGYQSHIESFLRYYNKIGKWNNFQQSRL